MGVTRNAAKAQVEQWEAEKKQRALARAAIGDIYNTFGRTANGSEMTQRRYESSKARNAEFEKNKNQILNNLISKGGRYELFGKERPDALETAQRLIDSKDPRWDSFQKNKFDAASERARARAKERLGFAPAPGDLDKAYQNNQKWNQNFDRIYNNLVGFHTDKLNSDQRMYSDAMKAQLMRQGMYGSHLDTQQGNEIADARQRGMATIRGIASSTRDQAKSSTNSIMNNAITAVNAGNLDAANQAVLSNQIQTAMDSAYDQATAQQLDNLFGGLTDAYRLRQQNKGETAATQAYFSNQGRGGMITGG